MKLVKILCFLFVIGSLSNSYSQAIMKIDFESFDMGEVPEGKPAEHDFKLYNTGKTPLLIADIKASCGCTTPLWSTQPIKPGEFGTVKAVYNTQGRPGFFNKSITITTNAENPTAVVYIKGSVVKAEEAKKYSDTEIKLSPKIVFEKPEHNFGKVEKGTRLTLKLAIQNLGRSDLRISSVSASCGCVTFTQKQDFIKSGESGMVELIYTPVGMNDQKEIVYFKSNDVTAPSKAFTINAQVLESLKNSSILMENNSSVPFK
jgi:hypothetical protein